MSEEDDKFTPKDAENKRKYYESVFNKIDKNKSGHIELTELDELLKKEVDVPSNITEKIFRASDKDKNGVLDKKEFQQMVEHKDYNVLFSKYVNLYIHYVLPKGKLPPEVEPDGPYEQAYSCWPPPIGIIIITIVEIICFVIDEYSISDTLESRGPMADILLYDPFKREQCWRYLTYMLVHVGYMHLLVNLIVQLCLGIPLEMVHKGFRVLSVYVSGVVAGSLGTSIFSPRIYLAGASGGVYALITGHMGTIIMNWNEMEFPLIQLAVFLIITTVDVGTSIYNHYVLQIQDNVGYAAHIAGGIAGLLVGIWNLKNFEPMPKEKYMWWGALTIFLIFMGIMIMLNIFWTDHFLIK